MTTTGKRQCAGYNRRGEPCGCAPLQDSDFCYFHDPDTAEKRRASRAKGGRARHGRHLGGDGDPDPVTIKKPGDVLPVLSEAINDVRRLENSVNRARAIGYLCGVIVKAFDVTNMQQELAALRAVLAARG
jgi:hypothetical protein